VKQTDIIHNTHAAQLYIIQRTKIDKPYMSSLDMSEYRSRGNNKLSEAHFG